MIGRKLKKKSFSNINHKMKSKIVTPEELGDTHDFVEDGRVVIDVHDGDLERANVVELGPAIVRREDGEVNLLLTRWLIPIETVCRPYIARGAVDLELELLTVSRDEAVRDGALNSQKGGCVSIYYCI